MEFWDIKATDILPLLLCVGIWFLAYSFVKGARNYLHIQTQMSSIILISGILTVLIFFGARGVIHEEGLLGILGSLIGYVLGSSSRASAGHKKDNDE